MCNGSENMIGNGYVNKIIEEDEFINLINKALEKDNWKGKKVLLVLPDLTRSAPISLMYRTIYNKLKDQVDCVDGLIALGTHSALSMNKIFERLGITEEEYNNTFSKKSKFYNHEWQSSDKLKKIGEISKDKVSEITNGIIKENVSIVINNRIFEYDHLMVLGPVFPHEVVGFSGGNKYFFPGISGEDIINMFHWLGAVITNEVINGKKDTPVRKVLNYAAKFIDIPRTYFNVVVNYKKTHGLYIGDDVIAWGSAADLSASINIKHVNRRYKKILGVAPKKYEDVWTAGKVAYKTETVLEDGGDLIIYAPHITEVSVMHGEIIEKIGYHVRDYYLKRMEQFSDIPGGIMAHSTHVKGSGSFDNDIEKPRINVILATGIPEEICKKINLGYLNPDTIDFKDWKNKEDEGVLFIPEAGEVLYKFFPNLNNQED
ncbi:MAG: lactate racemase domain-containing protein [Clostridiales bacterium]